MENEIDWSGCATVETILVTGTRMPVQIILDHAERGWTAERIADNWEGITLEQVQAVLRYRS